MNQGTPVSVRFESLLQVERFDGAGFVGEWS